jgi:ATP-dependent RNA helicase DDX42
MTGSGKTFAYVIPAIVHVMNNAASSLPRVAVVCPTRELAIQIEQEIYRFAKKSRDKFTSLALTGGLSKFEQFKQLSKGCDVVVGNPGRMIDLIQMKRGLDLSGVSMCVLDEADRMFKMGFENQIRTIVQRIRPDRQTLMFSATMPPRIEKLAREILTDPIRVVVGAVGQAASVIDQNVFICHSDEEKYVWIAATVPALLAEGGRTLIFVNSKTTGEELVRRMKAMTPVAIGAIHGDLDQSERMRLMTEFRTGRSPILVATDVAARGIDVQGVTCVIEFDAARDFDTHTHRIGRTGRAGVPGTSWTLVSDTDSKIAAHIVESIEALGMKSVPSDLLALAMKHVPFKAARTMVPESKKEIPDDPSNWEPLTTHFKQGRSESLS